MAKTRGRRSILLMLTAPQFNEIKGDPVKIRRPWTEDDIKLAWEMRAAGHFYEEIDWALKRRAGTTKRQLESVDRRHSVRSIRVPDDMSAELDVLAGAQPALVDAGFL
jgi:hypothetical protein